MKKHLKLLVLAPLFGLLLFVPGRGQVSQNAHTVALSWTVPTVLPASYGVYRATVTGGPYTRIANPSALTVGTPQTPITGYNDGTGVGGTKYFYVVTSIDQGGVESIFSNEANAVFPANPLPPTALTAVPK